MNIYALEGFLVTVNEKDGSFHGGTEIDKIHTKKYLVPGKVYTVERTKVHNVSTDVWLKEVPGTAFNSTNLVDVKPQNETDDTKHPDWARYHR
jgi:hypothetical protein